MFNVLFKLKIIVLTCKGLKADNMNNDPKCILKSRADDAVQCFIPSNTKILVIRGNCNMKSKSKMAMA